MESLPVTFRPNRQFERFSRGSLDRVQHGPMDDEEPAHNVARQMTARNLVGARFEFKGEGNGATHQDRPTSSIAALI